MRWLNLTVIVCLALGGCRVTLPKRDVLPVLSPRAWQSAHGSSNAPTADWWRKFGDTRLTALVHEAVIRNPDLRATATRLEQAQLRAAVAGRQPPTLEASLNSTKQKNNYIGLPFGGGGVMTSRYTSHGLSLASNWELDVWGRLKAGERMAAADVEAARANLWAARHSLAAQVVKAWVALTEANEQLNLAKTNIIILDTTVKQSELRYGLGVSPALDVRLARTNLATVEAAKEQWQSAREENCRRLETLLGRYPTGFILGDMRLPELIPEVPAGVPSDLLTRRPDIAASTARVLSAKAGINEAQAELFPRLALTGSTGTSSEKLKNLVNNNFLVWSLGGNITQPIFNGKKLRNTVRLREAQAAEAVFNHRRIVITAFGEVETALTNEAILAAREGHLAEAAEQAGKALTLAEERYSRGLEPFVTVLESQRRFTEARSQRVSARRLRLENRANLHLALGGDFLLQNGGEK